jgi:hypothetical protein
MVFILLSSISCKAATSSIRLFISVNKKPFKTAILVCIDCNVLFFLFNYNGIGSVRYSANVYLDQNETTMFLLKVIRHGGRSYSSVILIFITISSFVLTLYLYHKDKYQGESNQNIPITIVVQPRTLPSITTTIEKIIKTGIIIEYVLRVNLVDCFRVQLNLK